MLAVAFVVMAALSRWRPAWLLGPGLVGIGWVSVIGAGRAWAGYLGGARHLVAYLTAPGPLPHHLDDLGALAAGWHRWLAAQIPLALIAAAAEAGLAGRLTSRRTCRPGLLVATRRRCIRASLRRGELATADGACLGVIQESGRRAAVSWLEAAGGVLVTGQDAAAVTRTGLDLATAAILHRKAVLIVDLTDGSVSDGHGGSRSAPAVLMSVLRRITAASADVAAPLAVFGSGGGCYEPFSDAGPATAASMLLSMIDWPEEGPARRAFCEDYVRAAWGVIASGTPSGPTPAAAGTAAGSQRNILDDLAALASQLRADQPAITSMAEQVAWLRRSAPGAAIRRPSNSAEAIDIGHALALRQVVFFPLDLREHGPVGLMVARLVMADLARILAERSGAPADCLVWINGCDALDKSRIADTVASGQNAGIATIVSTASGAAAAALAGQVNVVVVRGRPPQSLTSEGESRAAPSGLLPGGRMAPAGQLGLAGEALLGHGDSLVLPAALLAADRGDALSLRVSGPVQRLIPGCRVVAR